MVGWLNAPAQNYSFIWRCLRCRWRDTKFRPSFGAKIWGGSLTCQACCDKGLRFLRHHRNRPINWLPLTTSKGTYANSDPHDAIIDEALSNNSTYHVTIDPWIIKTFWSNKLMKGVWLSQIRLSVFDIILKKIINRWNITLYIYIVHWSKLDLWIRSCIF